MAMVDGHTVSAAHIHGFDLDDPRKIVKFCAEEVAYQMRGPLQVSWMFDAWQWAMNPVHWERDLLGTVMQLGFLVEHEVNNPLEFRKTEVQVGYRICPHPSVIHIKMAGWASDFDQMTPLEAYVRFELIHPFRDGNGRVGKIIFNYKNHTMLNPIFPNVDWDKIDEDWKKCESLIAK